MLERLRNELGSFTIRKVDILLHPRTALREGITMIPTLKAGDKTLSGLLLDEEKIRTFLTGLD